jgi:hypothetical protein
MPAPVPCFIVFIMFLLFSELRPTARVCRPCLDVGKKIDLQFIRLCQPSSFNLPYCPRHYLRGGPGNTSWESSPRLMDPPFPPRKTRCKYGGRGAQLKSPFPDGRSRAKTARKPSPHLPWRLLHQYRLHVRGPRGWGLLDFLCPVVTPGDMRNKEWMDGHHAFFFSLLHPSPSLGFVFATPSARTKVLAAN